MTRERVMTDDDKGGIIKSWKEEEEGTKMKVYIYSGCVCDGSSDVVVLW